MKKAIRQTSRAATNSAEAKDSKVQALLSQAASTVDRAASRGVIHWKTAARKKSRLAKRVAAQLAATTPAVKA